MPKICGGFSFSVEKDFQAEIERALHTLVGFRLEKQGVWTKGNLGLGQQSSGTEIEFHKTENSHNEFEKDLCIVADAVLTNRTELLTEFGVLLSDQDRWTDRRLILESYLKWGRESPKYLEGDFAAAIWDGRKQKLFCFRDQLGAASLFFYKDKNAFIFSSDIKGIFCFEGIEKGFNRDKLAVLLLPEPHTYAADQTWYKNVSPFPAGTSFSIDLNGISSSRYWTPGPVEKLPYKKDEEIIHAFRDLFFDNIDARLRSGSPTASLLSGGLDSSSIVSVAAKILESQNRELNVFSCVLPTGCGEQFSDERYYIDQFKTYPNVKTNYVSVPDAGPFSDLESLFENQESPYVTSRHYLYRAVMRRTADIGATTLFEGCFGEMGATSHAWGGFAEMFAKFRWFELWRELSLRNKLYDDSVVYNIRANVISLLLPQALINLRHGRIGNEIPFSKYHPIREDVAQDFLQSIDFYACLPDRISPNHQKNQLRDLRLLQLKTSDCFLSNLGKEPVEIKHPMLDKKLVEFTLAVPLRLKYKDGYSRYLIRAALDKTLPPKIQWRTSKTPFSPDYFRRYNSQIGGVRELLATIRPNDPLREVLDIEKTKAWAQLPINDNETDQTKVSIARDHLPQAVYLIYFLRNFSEFRL